MSKAQQIRDYLAKHPGSTVSEIHKATNIGYGNVSNTTTVDVARGKMRREEDHRTLSNVKAYRYFLTTPTQDNVVLKPNTPKPPSSPKVAKTQPMEANDDLTAMIQSLSNQLASQIAAQVVVSLQSQLQQQLAAVIPPVALPAPSTAVTTLNEIGDDVLTGMHFDDADLTPVIHAPATYKSQPKVRLRKVGIVGLLPQQAGIISAEFGDAFDLHFWNDDGQNKLKSLGIGCECVLVTKWAAHRTTETLQSVGAKWRKVHGAVDELRTILTDLFVKEAA